MKEPYVIVNDIMYKAEDAVVVFKDKHNKVYNIDVPRLIKVFNNNIWENKKSVK
mgnify:FL=1